MNRSATPPPGFGASPRGTCIRQLTEYFKQRRNQSLGVTLDILALVGIGLATVPITCSARTASNTDSPLAVTTESSPATRPPATQPPTADFTAVADACALPTSTSLQRLAPGGENKAWHTSTDSWTCLRAGLEESTPGTPGGHQLRTVLISLSITSAKPSHDATERAREAFAAQRDRDRATWGRGYRVLDVGNDAYSGYSAIGGDGKAKATVRLKRPDLGGQASGVSLVVLQHSRDLFPKCSPWAAPVAAGEAAYLRVHHHRPPVDREIGHRSLAPRMDVGGLNGTSRARDQALSAAGPYPDSLAFIRYIVDDQAGQP